MARWFVDRSPQRGIPSVRLRSLLPDARFLGCDDLLACGCSSEVRRLEPGDVFVATGDSSHADIVRAIERGAAAVLLESPLDLAGRPQVIVRNARRALGQICHALAGNPAEQLSLVAITGVSGKTAIAHYLRAIEEAAGGRAGYVGSDGWSNGSMTYPAGASAPSAESLAQMLSSMLECGCRSGVIAAPAEDWNSRRLEGVSFDAAVIADGGLAMPGCQDQNRAEMRQGHARPFHQLAPGGVAVVHADDPEAELMGGVNLDSQRVTFALGRSDDVDVCGRVDRLDASGTRLALIGFEREASVHLPVVGTRRALHAVAAAAVARSLGFRLDLVVAGLESVSRIPGRFERIAIGQPFELRVERTRAAVSLAEALVTLREVSRGKVHCVLDISGNGSHDAHLARVAEELADSVVITIDPTTAADPDQALDRAVNSLARPGRVRLDTDRQSAIEAALAIAQAGDGVLLAGGPARSELVAGRSVQSDNGSIALRWLHRNVAGRVRRSA
jgi:UDP-N-acetylmuramoyl-L-alanyl-D-glutamate--2,6-diaminopimelate ligase